VREAREAVDWNERATESREGVRLSVRSCVVNDRRTEDGDRAIGWTVGIELRQLLDQQEEGEGGEIKLE